MRKVFGALFGLAAGFLLAGWLVPDEVCFFSTIACTEKFTVVRYAVILAAGFAGYRLF